MRKDAETHFRSALSCADFCCNMVHLQARSQKSPIYSQKSPTYPRLQMNPVTAKISATERAAEMCFRDSNSKNLYHTFLIKHLDLFKSEISTLTFFNGPRYL